MLRSSTRRHVATCTMTLLACLLLAGCRTRSIATVTEAVPDQVKWILLDAHQYEVLWQRWTVVDWVLGLFAAATAIAAAVKNAFSTHQMATTSKTADGRASVNVDWVVMVCALLAVVATTLDSKMHAAQTAERYRQGDLLLQEAIMDYRLGTADEPVRRQNLLEAWHQAQRILEGAPAVPAKGQTMKLEEPANTEPSPAKKPESAETSPSQ